VTTYDVTIERDGRFWLIYPHGIDRVAQARSYAEVAPMARACIAMPQSQKRNSISIGDIHVKGVSDVVEQIGELRAQSRRLRQEATQLSQQAAKHLHSQGVPVTDIGAILKLSHQRVSQLLVE